MAAAAAGGVALDVGCTWPGYLVDDSVIDAPAEVNDVGVADTGVDTGPIDTGPFVLPDGRTCSGHDEDGDGVPDECDNCPNVPNADQSGGDIGVACAAPTSFASPAKRLYFDPFKNIGPFQSFGNAPDGGVGGLFAEDKDGDSFLGGTIVDDDIRFVVGSTGSAGSAVIATTSIVVHEEDPSGSAGIILRVTGADASKRFFLCGLNTQSGFGVAHTPDTGCGGGSCGAVAFAIKLPDGGTDPAQSPMPSDVPHKIGDAIGLRASVTMGDGATSGEFECRVFDPKKPSTLQSTDAQYALRVTVASSRWIPSGEVGLYTKKSKAQFLSLDILRGP